METTAAIIPQKKKKKIYEFHLLGKRPIYLRPDLIIVSIVTAVMFGKFGWRMTDMEDLMAVGLLVLAITFNGVLLLSNFWSVAIHEFFAYYQVDGTDIDTCTNVRVTLHN